MVAALQTSNFAPDFERSLERFSSRGSGRDGHETRGERKPDFVLPMRLEERKAVLMPHASVDYKPRLRSLFPPLLRGLNRRLTSPPSSKQHLVDGGAMN
jgi:hypothetical protein